ncbi:MAG: hypothetical protein IKL79_05350 [Clostridia bacterium]|nr:hypothetical protein [Clostridia bacterium]MBR3681410.1 hypothetical protein [Clostridia bacterium]
MRSFLHFRYVYSFYSDGELMLEDVIDERIEVAAGCRFTIHDQEDGSFLVSELRDTALGKMAVLTFPNKDNLCLYEGRAEELSYDEYYTVMGDDNHNVYVGTVVLEAE